MAEQFYGATDTGRIRDNNEDAFLVQPIWGGASVAACVIDGVGGYEGGEVAAAIARDTILNIFSRQKGDAIALMKESFIRANKAIHKEKQNRNPHMACVLTMAVADVKNNQFYYAHVGDTRLYLFRDESLVKITKDQSFVGFLEDNGRLSESAAMAHPKRNEINKALGFGDVPSMSDDYIETGSSPFLPGDLLMLCSDGLTDLVPVAEMKAILQQSSSLQQKVHDLIDAANEAGGKDNITVVLVQNNKKPLKQKAKMPAAVKKVETEQHKPSEQIAPLIENVHSGSTVTEKQVPKPTPLDKNRRNKTAVIALSVLCLVLLGGLIYLIWKQYKGSVSRKESLAVEKNKGETNLQEAINYMVGDTLMLDAAVFGTSIKLTDTIKINRDSLYIKGSNLITRDSNYVKGGPAFYFGPACKWIVLDGLQFENFPIGLLTANNNVLELKNTSFINCDITLAFAGNGQDFFHGMFVNTRKATDTSMQKRGAK